MKQEVDNVPQSSCKYRLLSFRYNREIKVLFILQKCSDLKNAFCIKLSRVQFWEKLNFEKTLKMQQLYQRALHGVHAE